MNKTMYDITPPDYQQPWLYDYDWDDDGFYYCNVLCYIAAEASPRVRRTLCFHIHYGEEIPYEVIEEGLAVINQTVDSVQRAVSKITKLKGETGNSAYLNDKDWPLLVRELENRPSIGEGWFNKWLEQGNEREIVQHEG